MVSSHTMTKICLNEDGCFPLVPFCFLHRTNATFNVLHLNSEGHSGASFCARDFTRIEKDIVDGQQKCDNILLGSSSFVDEDEELLPWGERQSWALRDNLPKYTFAIPPPTFLSNRTNRKQNDISRKYVLWRTMLRDVTELNGYDLSQIRREAFKLQTETMRAEGKRHGTDRNLKSYMPAVLPLLERYQFELNDGISGTVFGFPGVEDGTRLTTPPLKNAHQTIPLGYVYIEETATQQRTYDKVDSVLLHVYELGTSMKEKEFKQGYSLDPSNLKVRSYAEDRAVRLDIHPPRGDTATRDMLINVGGSTVSVLAAAAVANMLSHHLTINMFWV